jgi:hypothetical protein
MQGVYVLQDNSFKPISRISSWEGRADAIRRAKLVRALLACSTFSVTPKLGSRQYAAMPAGIIRGALSRLGFQTTVTPEITSIPQCMSSYIKPRGILIDTVQVHSKSNCPREHDQVSLGIDRPTAYRARCCIQLGSPTRLQIHGTQRRSVSVDDI